jgi:hypothetical protein
VACFRSTEQSDAPTTGDEKTNLKGSGRIPTPVIGVAAGTVVGKMGPAFRDQLGRRRERVLLARGLRWDRELPGRAGYIAFHTRRLVTGAETAPYEADAVIQKIAGENEACRRVGTTRGP